VDWLSQKKTGVTMFVRVGRCRVLVLLLVGVSFLGRVFVRVLLVRRYSFCTRRVGYESRTVHRRTLTVLCGLRLLLYRCNRLALSCIRRRHVLGLAGVLFSILTTRIPGWLVCSGRLSCCVPRVTI